jgi:sugar lactone lactonase YvrE
MSRSREPEQAALYRFDTGGLARIRTITVGNGTDWDVERGRMYHVDSVTPRIDVFDYDIALPTPFVTCPAFGGDVVAPAVADEVIG